MNRELPEPIEEEEEEDDEEVFETNATPEIPKEYDINSN